jgi:hypothetical protein
VQTIKAGVSLYRNWVECIFRQANRCQAIALIRPCYQSHPKGRLFSVDSLLSANGRQWIYLISFFRRVVIVRILKIEWAYQFK